MTCVKFRLRDIPELEYRSTDKKPRGELCIKGNSIFKGYYKDKEKTEEAFD
jgi:long-chain acyl-CoA synthetase